MHDNDFNRRFARMSLSGSPLFRTQVAGSSNSTPAARPAAAAETVPPPPAPSAKEAAQRSASRALDGLRALQSRLNAAQVGALATITQCNDAASSAKTNADLLPPIPRILTTAGEDITLDRSPSFLLALPILGDMEQGLPADVDGFAERLSPDQKAVLAAQAATLKAQVKGVQQRLVDQTMAGERFRTMPHDREALNEFLTMRKPLIRRTINACLGPAAQRDALLLPIFSTLANDYLDVRGALRTGLPDGTTEDLDGVAVGDTPVTVLLRPGYGMPEHDVVGRDGMLADVIRISTDGIDDFCADPKAVDNTCPGWSPLFKRCSIGQQQAAILLQQLFFGLAEAEQTAAILEHMAAGGEFETVAPALRESINDMTYRGTDDVGDSIEQAPGDLSQRKQNVIPLAVLPLLSRAQAAIGNGPLFADPELESWITSPELNNDLLSMVSPHHRLRLAQTEAVARSLRDTGLFST